MSESNPVHSHPADLPPTHSGGVVLPFKSARLARQLLAMLGDVDALTLVHYDNKGQSKGGLRNNPRPNPAVLELGTRKG